MNKMYIVVMSVYRIQPEEQSPPDNFVTWMFAETEAQAVASATAFCINKKPGAWVKATQILTVPDNALITHVEMLQVYQSAKDERERLLNAEAEAQRVKKILARKEKRRLAKQQKELANEPG